MFITDVITLDPAAISKKHSSAIEDNFITSAKPSTVQPYAGTGMTISNSSTNWGTSKAFVKFLDSGLPLIPGDAALSHRKDGMASAAQALRRLSPLGQRAG